MIRVGILGAGNHSRSSHGPAFRMIHEQRPDTVELAAVCDRNGEKAEAYARDFGFALAYDDVEDMLRAEPIDALVVITPIALTRQVVGKLIPRGIPMLIEKPPGRTAEEAAQLRAIAQEHQTPIMVSMNRRFALATTKAHAWLARHPERAAPYFAVSRMLRHDRREPGFLMDTAIHAIDMLLSFMDTPVRVTGQSPCPHLPYPDITDTTRSAHVTFASGATAVVVIAPTTGATEETCEILGPDYTIRIDIGSPNVRITDNDKVVLDWRQPDATPGVVAGGTFHETEAFLKAVVEGKGYRPNMDDAIMSMRVVEAVAAGGTHAL